MKGIKAKILIAGILLVLLGNTAYSRTEYNPQTQVLTFDLTPGWNLVHVVGGEGVQEDCGEKHRAMGKNFIPVFLWSPTLKRYVFPPLDESFNSPAQQRVREDMNAGYFYPISGWFMYMSTGCSVTVPYREKGLSPFLKIVPGWQFITKYPWIDEAGFDSVFQDCDVVKLNQFDNEQKKWKHSPSLAQYEDIRNAFDSAGVGEVLVMKFTTYCDMNPFATPVPPPLE